MAVPAPSASAAAPSARPAGFWQRVAAWLLDAAIIAPLAGWLAWPWIAAPGRAWLEQVRALLQHTGQTMGAAIFDGAPLPRLAITLLHDPALGQATAAIRSATWAVAWPALLAFALLGAIYHVAGECAPWQASPGKRLLGLHAADRHGRRLGPGRALARYSAGALSWATLNLGHLMATAAPAHLALHDRCSGTRVRAARAGLPRWGCAWLTLLAIAGLVAVAWLAQAASTVMQAALERALSWPG